MNAEQNIKDLQSHVNTLQALMKDPHPILERWTEKYETEMDWLSEFFKTTVVDTDKGEIITKNLRMNVT